MSIESRKIRREKHTVGAIRTAETILSRSGEWDLACLDQGRRIFVLQSKSSNVQLLKLDRVSERKRIIRNDANIVKIIDRRSCRNSDFLPGYAGKLALRFSGPAPRHAQSGGEEGLPIGENQG